MELPEVQHLEDPQNRSDAPVARPMRMAIRNSAVALLGIGLIAGGIFFKLWWYENTGEVYWWILPALAAFAVVTCFAHALVAAKFGGRRATNVLKIAAALVLAAILFAVWWSLR
jgi:hypothetical protein